MANRGSEADRDAPDCNLCPWLANALPDGWFEDHMDNRREWSVLAPTMVTRGPREEESESTICVI
jgi:hypothetical protein